MQVERDGRRNFGNGARNKPPISGSDLGLTLHAFYYVRSVTRGLIVLVVEYQPAYQWPGK